MMPNSSTNHHDETIAVDLVIVDDDCLLTQLLDRKLRRSSMQYLIFNDSLDALAYLEQATPRALLVDLRMPKLDGIQLIHELKQRNRKMPLKIFVCSSCLPTAEDCEAIDSLGASVVTKDDILKSNAFEELLDFDNI